MEDRTKTKIVGWIVLTIVMSIYIIYFCFKYRELSLEACAGVSIGIIAGWLLGFVLKRDDKISIRSLSIAFGAISLLGGFVAKYVIGDSAVLYYLINLLGGLLIHRSLALIGGDSIETTISRKRC